MDRLAAKLAERFDPEGSKNPEGEWRPEKRQVEAASGAVTGQKRRSGRDRGEPEPVAEPKGRTGSETCGERAK